MNTLKKAIKFLPVLTIVFFLASCGGGDTPTKVSEGFLAAMEKGDLTAAKEFVTEKQKSSLDMLAGDETIKGKGYKVTEGSEKVEGETATVGYTTSDGTEKSLNLVKENGAWKVDFNKMEFIGGGDAGLPTEEPAMEEVAAEDTAAAPAEEAAH